MIITTSTNEKQAFSVLINKYADLAFQCMALFDTLPETFKREECMDELISDMKQNGMRIINDSTVEVSEEHVLGSIKCATIVVNTFQKLAPIIIPAVKQCIPIIEDAKDSLEKV